MTAEKRRRDRCFDLVTLLGGSRQCGDIASRHLADLVEWDGLQEVLYELCTVSVVDSDEQARLNAAQAIELICRKYSKQLSKQLSDAKSDEELLSMSDIDIFEIERNGNKLYNAEIDALDREVFGLSGLYGRDWVKKQRMSLKRIIGKETGQNSKGDVTIASKFISTRDLVCKSDFSYHKDSIENTGETVKRRSASKNENLSGECKEWFARLFRAMVVRLLHPTWVYRHGVCLGVSAILRGLLETADISNLFEVPFFLVQDVSTTALSLLVLDRFLYVGQTGVDGSNEIENIQKSDLLYEEIRAEETPAGESNTKGETEVLRHSTYSQHCHTHFWVNTAVGKGFYAEIFEDVDSPVRKESARLLVNALVFGDISSHNEEIVFSVFLKAIEICRESADNITLHLSGLFLLSHLLSQSRCLQIIHSIGTKNCLKDPAMSCDLPRSWLNTLLDIVVAGITPSHGEDVSGFSDNGDVRNSSFLVLIGLVSGIRSWSESNLEEGCKAVELLLPALRCTITRVCENMNAFTKSCLIVDVEEPFFANAIKMSGVDQLDISNFVQSCVRCAEAILSVLSVGMFLSLHQKCPDIEAELNAMNVSLQCIIVMSKYVQVCEEEKLIFLFYHRVHLIVAQCGEFVSTKLCDLPRNSLQCSINSSLWKLSGHIAGLALLRGIDVSQPHENSCTECNSIRNCHGDSFLKSILELVDIGGIIVNNSQHEEVSYADKALLWIESILRWMFTVFESQHIESIDGKKRHQYSDIFDETAKGLVEYLSNGADSSAFDLTTPAVSILLYHGSRSFAKLLKEALLPNGGLTSCIISLSFKDLHQKSDACLLIQDMSSSIVDCMEHEYELAEDCGGSASVQRKRRFFVIQPQQQLTNSGKQQSRKLNSKLEIYSSHLLLCSYICLQFLNAYCLGVVKGTQISVFSMSDTPFSAVRSTSQVMKKAVTFLLSPRKSLSDETRSIAVELDTVLAIIAALLKFEDVISTESMLAVEASLVKTFLQSKPVETRRTTVKSTYSALEYIVCDHLVALAQCLWREKYSLFQLDAFQELLRVPFDAASRGMSTTAGSLSDHEGCIVNRLKCATCSKIVDPIAKRSDPLSFVFQRSLRILQSYVHEVFRGVGAKLMPEFALQKLVLLDVFGPPQDIFQTHSLTVITFALSILKSMNENLSRAVYDIVIQRLNTDLFFCCDEEASFGGFEASKRLKDDCSIDSCQCPIGNDEMAMFPFFPHIMTQCIVCLRLLYTAPTSNQSSLDIPKNLLQTLSSGPRDALHIKTQRKQHMAIGMLVLGMLEQLEALVLPRYYEWLKLTIHGIGLHSSAQARRYFMSSFKLLVPLAPLATEYSSGSFSHDKIANVIKTVLATNEKNSDKLDILRDLSSADGEVTDESRMLKLKNYQIKGVEWVLSLWDVGLGGVLADEMGLGKTIQAISSMKVLSFRTRQSEKTVLPCLVVCPALLVSHWMNETTKFAPSSSKSALAPVNVMALVKEQVSKRTRESEQSSAYGRAVPNRYARDATSAQLSLQCTSDVLSSLPPNSLVIISYTALRNMHKQLTLLQEVMSSRKYEHLKVSIPSHHLFNFVFSCCTLDEGHICRNPKSQTAKAVYSIRADHRLVLTGTPLQNSLEDVWAIMEFVLPGYLGPRSSFQEEFVSPIKQGFADEDCTKLKILSKENKSSAHAKKQLELSAKGLSTLTRLHSQILPFILRRTKESCLDLPGKTVHEVFCPLSSWQKLVYGELQRSLIKMSDTELAHQLERFYVGKLVGKRDISETLENDTPTLSPLHALTALKSICIYPRVAPSEVSFESRRSSINDTITSLNLSLSEVHGNRIDMKEMRLECSGKLCQLANVLVESGVAEKEAGYPWKVADEVCNDYEENDDDESEDDDSSIDDDGYSTESDESDAASKASNDNVLPVEEESNSREEGSIVEMPGQKCVVFAEHLRTLDLIEELVLKPKFPSIIYKRLDGSVTPSQRASIAETFNKESGRDTPRVLLATIAACGLGINLFSVEVVVFIEHSWNPFADLQAMDRVHRIGTSKPVSIYRLLAESTIETRIQELQSQKRFLAERVIQEEQEATQNQVEA